MTGGLIKIINTVIHFDKVLAVKSFFFPLLPYKGFPGSLVGKESACNAGDPGWIPGLGKFSGEGIGYPLQYSWASLVTQLLKKSVCNAGDLGLIPGLG